MAGAKVSSIKPVRLSSAINLAPSTKIKSVLPFRVKFSNITIQSYSPTNPGGLGVRIIEYNNYIL